MGRNFLQHCDHASFRNPVVIDLKTVELRPTHYSIRALDCGGMNGKWNLEASSDGVTWHLLHEAHQDSYVRGPNHDQNQEAHRVATYWEREGDCDMKALALLEFAERRFRRTFALQPLPTRFYRYFRVIGADDPNERGCCLHGHSFELFGDVYEP